MSSIHRVGEKARNRRRPPKSALLETIDKYTISRDGSMLRIDRDGTYLTYRATQAEAHQAIKDDKIRQATMAVRTVSEKAA